MSNAARFGDAISHGGGVVTGSGDVYINGLPAAIVAGSTTVCSCPAKVSVVATGSCSVYINGCPTARVGDLTGCGGAVCTGSGDVFIG